MSSRATLGAAAEDRKARLAKLRSIKRKQPDDEVVAPESSRMSPAVAPPMRTGDEEDVDAGHVDEGDRADAPPPREDTAEPDVARLYLSGRNYDPEARGAKLGFETQPNLAAGDNTLEAKAAVIAEQARREQDDDDAASSSAAAAKPIDLFKLQPKKPNWDLKRELNKRLEPLNARTDMAIARLLRERLQGPTPPAPAEASQPRATTAAAADSLLEGAALVESLRLRELEAEEDERRERALEELQDDGHDA